MKTSAIVSYRARLARNLHGYPFPNRMDGLRRREMIDAVGQTFRIDSRRHRITGYRYRCRTPFIRVGS